MLVHFAKWDVSCVLFGGRYTEEGRLRRVKLESIQLTENHTEEYFLQQNFLIQYYEISIRELIINDLQGCNP